MLRLFVLRPVFEIPLNCSREIAIQRLANVCSEFAQPKLFLMHGEYGELHLPVESHRLWSPHLSFYVSQEHAESILRCRFAPRLEIWTFIWVLYLAMAFTAFFSLVMEFSIRAIGDAAWWHWIGIAAIISIVLIYLTANVGQQLSSDQMDILRHQLDDHLAKAELLASSTSVEE